MHIRVRLSALYETRWHDYATRFILGGLITVLAGMLVEKYQRERKEKAGLRGSRRGNDAAALESVGAALGSIGLLAFGATIG